MRWTSNNKNDPKSLPPSRIETQAAVLSALRMGATSFGLTCPVCGTTTTREPRRALELVYDPCPTCGATYNERKRAMQAGKN